MMYSGNSAEGARKGPVYMKDRGDGYDIEGRSSNGVSVEGNHAHTITIASSGKGTPHNNMQPFEVVHRWKRTA